jgi:hypothetical protein
VFGDVNAVLSSVWIRMFIDVRLLNVSVTVTSSGISLPLPISRTIGAAAPRTVPATPRSMVFVEAASAVIGWAFEN